MFKTLAKILTLSTVLIFTSCEKQEEPVPVTDITLNEGKSAEVVRPYVTATRIGQETYAWKATEVSTVNDQEAIAFSASNEEGSIISIGFAATLQEGKYYQIGKDVVLFKYEYGELEWLAGPETAGSSGWIYIQSYTDKGISGKFEFMAVNTANDTYFEFKNGAFNVSFK